MTSDSQNSGLSDYPAALNIDYVSDGRNRITVFFRVVTLIPILLVVTGLQTLLWPVILMVLFRQKYPRWWFDFNLEVTKFTTRVSAYWMLLSDEYPSTDEEQSTHLTLDYPADGQLNRWLPLFKWILALPHYIVLWVLVMVAAILVFVSWFVILFTGKLPQGIHNYVVGVSRWSLRVQAYAFLLTTDKYPPFSLD
ncbi:DUF4389 domain-containing protein [Candidatus Lucifugimonas marina]|jgi:hypothetical protein|uniref:DUF4389 domain-containing protein n=1 Tax=Candidatus Lucifugimonas marina TaxID=3038979 RepID=A0AAJ5ZD20_9CHLR|nr:DUF4389 domain-containing protein [SAR202 cluster bacterium JH702]MDG0868423.1 DUF4389 domain-containing protein [SAR202 cluster bacterium JH639]WFG35056.1 DUF4389 domain-containing protein [SAR202 cluster bacterium JH545]WFG39013.1 DUF4389 domain-containing protein [SAR202 cluster bacterium JH1073]